MDIAAMAVQFLGVGFIIVALGLIICLLAFIGYHTYIKIQGKDKKIEVRTENENSNQTRHD